MAPSKLQSSQFNAERSKIPGNSCGMFLDIFPGIPERPWSMVARSTDACTNDWSIDLATRSIDRADPSFAHDNDSSRTRHCAPPILYMPSVYSVKIRTWLNKQLNHYSLSKCRDAKWSQKCYYWKKITHNNTNSKEYIIVRNVSHKIGYSYGHR